MKQLYLRWCTSLVLLIVSIIQSSAQIVLHEATDITQTKATLSADFPDLNTEHGFQYKYGTLPEIDDFSRIALSSDSDPVQIINKNSYPWSARTVKGWIESNPNVPIGKESAISIDVKVYTPTEITFEWSVDSEEGVGILTFYVDDVAVNSISGMVAFHNVTVSLDAGAHTLKWSYKKDKSSNLGLDLGMLRNLNIQNSTAGEWKSVYTTSNEVLIDNLLPNKSYLFRGFELGDTTSMLSFKTSSVDIDSYNIKDVSQTRAKFEYHLKQGDVNCNTKYQIIQGSIPTDPLVLALLGNNPTIVSPIFTGNYWSVFEDNGVSCGRKLNVAQSCSGSLTLELDLLDSTTISFDWAAESYNNLRFSLYIDGVYYSQLYSKASLSWEHKTIELSSGKHTIKWYTESNSRYGSYENMVGYIRNLNLNNPDIDCIDVSGNSFFEIENLIPDTDYSSRIQSYYSAQDSVETVTSQWISFHTLGVSATPPSLSNISQSSITAESIFTAGDAPIESKGYQYKVSDGTNWSTIKLEEGESERVIINRLKPSTSYIFRSYIQATGCNTTYSNAISINTLPVVAEIPQIKKVSQHQAILSGKILFGDANIYQRGMQFRKKGLSKWEDVEDGGNDSIFFLNKRNLEMDATYQARTYVQPAGCDVIYSDILEFNTLDTYFLNCSSNAHTQTSVTLEASLAETDDDASTMYGFEYFIASDGFFENANSFVQSDIIDVPVKPNDKYLKTVITGLTPQLGISWRAYALIDGTKTYYTSSNNLSWDFAGTDRAIIVATLKTITQTSISLELDATQEGDALISQIEYAFANSVQDTQDYSICGKMLTLNNLVPNHQYNIRFRGLVNERYCPLLKEISCDYSWFEYKTLPVDVNVSFSGITQTKAKMKVDFNSGDAEITDIRYRLNNDGILPYKGEQNIANLTPGNSYSVTIYAKVNGVESSWNANSDNNAFKFTTKSVSSNISVSEIYQTAAKISWTSNVGDATFVRSGLEFFSEDITFGSESGERLFNELVPNKSYSCRSYVETTEGGRVYSAQRSFTTKAISTSTLNVSNISNRSATMNGEIDCDSYSSAEFGFQWKQMEGWQSAPAFTKGFLRDDGRISIALVNGMLEPNTDYQYRAAVRYRDEIYTSNDWTTFRTESEFIYYPATVYTAFRTDRENNALILCGYFIAGSEAIKSQGYEYWQVGGQSPLRAYAPQKTVTITTDESMQHIFSSGELANGNYAVRAFVKTENGDVLYGATLGFNVSDNGYSSVDAIDSDNVKVFADGSTLKVVNANNLSCRIYDLRGLLIAEKIVMSEYEEFSLSGDTVYIIKLSNGKVMKLRL